MKALNPVVWLVHVSNIPHKWCCAVLSSSPPPPKSFLLGFWEKVFGDNAALEVRLVWVGVRWPLMIKSAQGGLDLSFALLWTSLLTCVDPKGAAVELGISLCATRSQAVCLSTEKETVVGSSDQFLDQFARLLPFFLMEKNNYFKLRQSIMSMSITVLKV